MRYIKRLPEPDILVQKRDEWQKKFEEKKAKNATARPDSSKYGNPSIRERLEMCSHRKCFYCESLLKGEPKEIDHFIEVAIAPELAYTWTNLYLSCSNCNDKVSHDVIPVDEVLDPCKSSDEEIRANITFEDECICSQPGSEKGLKTIQKFHLNTDLLDLKRGKWLRKIIKTAIEIQQCMIADKREKPTQEEKHKLLRYMQPDQPYSMMAEIFLRKKFQRFFT